MSGAVAGQAIATAAAGLVGAPFRLQGRDPITGLDCVGVITAAMAATGRPLPPLPSYTMRRTQLEPFDRLAALSGLREVTGVAVPGDVLVLRTGPVQWHAAVLLAGGQIVHAHAGLGRVVIGTTVPDWTIMRHWRV